MMEFRQLRLHTFEKIYQNEELHTTDKFQSLMQAMESNTKGEEIVASFPATEENYPKVIEVLQERVGKNKLLTQVHIRESFKLILNNLWNH